MKAFNYILFSNKEPYINRNLCLKTPLTRMLIYRHFVFNVTLSNFFYVLFNDSVKGFKFILFYNRYLLLPKEKKSYSGVIKNVFKVKEK